jgi:hypothetical protein
MPSIPLSPDQLQKYTQTLCGEREMAIMGRRREGLDEVWRQARQQYKGIDELNQRGRMEKGETLDSSLSPFRPQVDTDRSTVFVNITRPYTNAGTARVADILLPTGKMPWELRSTPISDLETIKGILGDHPVLAEQVLQSYPSLMEDPGIVEAAQTEAYKIIKDWLKESDWAGVVRRQIIEAGKVGTGIIKGPFPKERRVSGKVQEILSILISFPGTPESLVKQLEATLFFIPKIENIKVENCFPDPECGTDIQNGRYFFERIPEVTRRQLKNFMADPNYISSAIEKCLEEGPKRPGEKENGTKPKRPFELWLRTGEIEVDAGEGKKKSLGFGTVTLCNDRIIKVAQAPLESAIFPYWMLCWEPRDDSWAGIGIPEQIETPQRGLNASVRALMDNMGFSVGPQVLELDGIIEPVEGEDWKLRPYKRWKVKSGLPGVDAMMEAKNAMGFLEFPNYLEKIMPVIQYWLKMAEDTTGLSLLLQGQAVTDAVGVSQQLMNNSTTNLRLIVKEWDDRVCRPMLQAFYEWVQLYGPETAQGDAVVEAIGSTTLIVRELQQQALLQIGQQVLQPVYGISPSKWMETYLEGFQIDIERLRLTEEERQKLEQAEQQPDPSIQSAQIQAQTEVYKADLKKETDQLKLALEAQFKNLSLAQAQEAAALDAQTKLATTGLKGQQDLAAQRESSMAQLDGKRMDLEADPAKGSPKPQSMEQMEIDPQEMDSSGPPPQDVEAALAALGLNG